MQNIYKENILGSKFISYIFEAKKIEDVKRILKEIQKEHHKASHIVYAYICNDGLRAGGYNAKEPKGSAYSPILNFLLTNKAKNLVVFVIRYFKGKKMGKNNLIKSYLKMAKEVYNIFKKQNI